MDGSRVRHTVAFRLIHPANSANERRFLEDGAQLLSKIPTVERFEVLRQVSLKNPYAFGFSMEFADRAAYEAYNVHPDHVQFVRDRWEKEVEDFLELDYQAP